MEEWNRGYEYNYLCVFYLENLRVIVIFRNRENNAEIVIIESLIIVNPLHNALVLEKNDYN